MQCNAVQCVVQIIVHVLKWKEALRCSIRVCSVVLHLLKHNQTDGFTELCVLVLFKFESS